MPTYCQRYCLGIAFLVLLQTEVYSCFSLKTSLGRSSSGVISMTAKSRIFADESVKVLGVCGGIGAGKSTACKIMLSELECAAHIDSDAMAHAVYEPGSDVLTEIASTFGQDLLTENGEINRAMLGSIVFADVTAMKKLEQIVWPHVKSSIEEQIDLAKDTYKSTDGKIPVVVVEAAVLLDAGWQEFMDGVWCIQVSHKTACARLQENRGLSVEEAEKRILAQQSRRGIGNVDDEVTAKVISSVIDNNGSLDELRQSLAESLENDAAWY